MGPKLTVDSSSDESDFIRPRTPATTSLSEVMPLHPDETGDQYFARFEDTWEPDPDRNGFVRRKTQVTRVDEIAHRDAVARHRVVSDIEAERIAETMNETLEPKRVIEAKNETLRP